MDRPQLVRRLRITASVFFALIAVALCVLWVRSYWWNELVLCSIDQHFILVESTPGAFGFRIIPEESVDPWLVYRQPASEWRETDERAWREHSWGGFYFNFSQGPTAVAPYWFWLLIPIALAAFPWLLSSNRFSLRTLLIATTLVAVTASI